MNYFQSCLYKLFVKLLVKYNLQHYFTVMIDEATDLANIEQVVLVICSVNDNLTVTEDFIGLYKTESIESPSLVSIIKDVLLRMNLKLKYCRGQCYDGASNMTGVRNGVAKQLTDEETSSNFHPLLWSCSKPCSGRYCQKMLNL